MNLIEHDIDKDREKKEEMLARSGRKSVPFIDIEGIYLYGFSEDSIREAVELRRSGR